MPLFRYVCQDCKNESEVLVRGSETPMCPTCESTNLAKQLSLFAPVSAAIAEPVGCPAAGSCEMMNECCMN